MGISNRWANYTVLHRQLHGRYFIHGQKAATKEQRVFYIFIKITE